MSLADHKSKAETALSPPSGTAADETAVAVTVRAPWIITERDAETFYGPAKSPFHLILQYCAWWYSYALEVAASLPSQLHLGQDRVPGLSAILHRTLKESASDWNSLTSLRVAVCNPIAPKLRLRDGMPGTTKGSRAVLTLLANCCSRYENRRSILDARYRSKAGKEAAQWGEHALLCESLYLSDVYPALDAMSDCVAFEADGSIHIPFPENDPVFLQTLRNAVLPHRCDDMRAVTWVRFESKCGDSFEPTLVPCLDHKAEIWQTLDLALFNQGKSESIGFRVVSEDGKESDVKIDSWERARAIPASVGIASRCTVQLCCAQDARREVQPRMTTGPEPAEKGTFKVVLGVLMTVKEARDALKPSIDALCPTCWTRFNHTVWFPYKQSYEWYRDLRNPAHDNGFVGRPTREISIHCACTHT